MSPNVIVVTIEGLSAGLVGSYGSSTSLTPALDSFASQGILLDQCFVDSMSASQMLRSLWSGRHALQQPHESPGGIWRWYSSLGGQGILITDCEQTARMAESDGCTNSCVIQLPSPTHPASQTAECVIAQFFTEAISLLSTWLSPSEQTGRLIWIHSRGLKLPWDAPLSMRARFTDADDPDPPEEVGPPGFEVTSSTDPDWVLGWGQVAAAQSAVIDESIELLHGWISQRLPSACWCLVGLGGVPLGEHGWLGWGRSELHRSELHQEELHVPAILLPQSCPPIGLRKSELCQLPDLGASIAELCGLKPPQDSWGQSMLGPPKDLPPQRWEAHFQVAMLLHQEKYWVRVPAWSLTYDNQGSDTLFVKPDDRWEVSNISVRCPEIVASMRELGQQFIEACRLGSRQSLPELNEHLCNLLR